MNTTSSKDLIKQAMSLGKPERVPVMCQLSIGHVLLKNPQLHPVDYFLSSDTYADGLLKIRELYDFDGVLMHKPGREPGIMEIVDSTDRDGILPTIFFKDGARVECSRDDDPYYRPSDDFHRPSVKDIDPENPLGWAPESFVRWCRHKGTAVYRTADEIPEYWFDCIDKVMDVVGQHYSIHGEVRSPFDHLLNIAGMENGLMGLIEFPDHTRALMETFTEMTIAWAVAQVRRGCDAIKLSSPYGGAGFISRNQYESWLVPFQKRVIDAVRAEKAFIYDHTCGAIGDRLDLMSSTGIHGLETLDPPPLGTVQLNEAKRILKDRVFIKGNVDPVNTVLKKDAGRAREDIEKVYAVGSEGGQYIMSTACSIPPAAPVENVRQMTDCVYEHAK